MKKTILISGGSDGLGKSIASKLSPNHQVIILSHNQEKLETVAKEIHCDYVVADVADYSSLKHVIDSLIGKYKNIDVLINNAGTWIEGSLEENDPNKIHEVICVNTLGTIFLTKLVIPLMKLNKSGRIINIVSEDGLKAKMNKSVYSASKWAITGFTKCLLEDLSPSGIGVTGIYPGMLKTSLFEKQGVERDLSTALDTAEVASLVEYVINLSSDTLIPDISIKNINNPKPMDDSGSPQITLDINPDMMTTQNGVPQTAPVAPAPITPITNTPGVIDITPGSGAGDHPSAVEDITPKDTIPTPIPTPTAPVTPITPVTPTGVVDITPGAPSAPAESITPVVESTDIPVEPGTHLVDVMPKTEDSASPAPTESVAMPVETTPALVAMETTTPPAESTPAVPETTTTPSPDTTTPTVQVELPPATVSPLMEDPDSVKLAK